MITNYIIYLNTLSNIEKDKQISIIFIFLEKDKQISIIFIFFIIILLICGILYLIKKKFLKENKNTIFQKFLKKL